MSVTAPATSTSELGDRFWSKVEPGGPDGTCLEWQRGRNEKGYGQFWFKGKTRLAHRVAYESHHGVVLLPEDVVLHSCDNPRCVNVEHHTIGTVLENNEDKKKKNRQSKGEGIASAKFTAAEIATIRQRAETEGIRAIARDLEVNHSTISRIVNKVNWNHV